MEYLITFLEGLASFVSPCMLPLLPLYISYFAGGVKEGDKERNTTRDSSNQVEQSNESACTGGLNTNSSSDGARTRARVLWRCLGFVLGFSVVFCTLGLLAGTLGQFLGKYRGVLTIVCGAVIVVFGLSYIGVIKLNFLKGLKRAKKVTSFWSAFVFGAVYSVSLTPCIGAMLGSALALAAASSTRFKGFLLLLSYCIGLGVPFIISALLLDKLKTLFARIKKHYNVLNVVCGALLVILGGILAFRGAMSIVNRYSGASSVYQNKIDKLDNEELEVTITDLNFKEKVLQSKKPVLVDFWASWCPPCKMLSPIIREIASEYKGVLVVGKVNVDDELRLANMFGISSIPTLILFKGGKIQKVHQGYTDKATLIKEFGLDLF